MKLARALAKLDTALARALVRVGSSRLDAATQAVVAGNIAADRAVVSAVTSLVAARDVRPETYNRVLSDYRALARLQAALDDLPASDAQAAAVTAAAAVAANLAVLDASSSRDALQAVKRELSALAELVALAVPVEETDTDDGEDTDTDNGEDTGTGTAPVAEPETVTTS